MLRLHASAMMEFVQINSEMLVQVRTDVAAARALAPSVELTTIANTLDTILAGSLPSDIEPVLPVDSSADLDPAIELAQVATDEQLDAVNSVDSPDVTPGGSEPVNSAPLLTGTAASSALEDSGYLFQPVATDADGDALTFTIWNRPGWASFNRDTGRLSGTPNNDDVGVYSNITITVSDAAASASTKPFSISVINTNDAPGISGNAPSSVTAGVHYSFQPSASDPDGDDLIFTIQNQPAWVAFNSGTGLLSGTPDNSDAGTYSAIKISVSDGSVSQSLSAFSISVNVNLPSNTPPAISGSPASSVAEDSSYLFQPTASDADGDDLTFGIQNRPSWASFNTGSGLLSGTPGNSDTGSYSNIMISVSDGSASTSLGPFSITVSNTNDAPTISGSPATKVDVDSAYSFQPVASDADGDDLTFGIQGRPSWASFNTGSGELSGTPGNSHTGSYSNIVVSVSDGTDTVSLQAFSIGVTAVPNSAPVINSVVSQDGALLVSYSVDKAFSYAEFFINGAASGNFDDDSNNFKLISDLTNGVTYNITMVVYDADFSKSPISNQVSGTPNSEGVETGSFTLNWTAPAARSDGTPLSLADIACYRIYYSESPGSYPNSVAVTDGSATSITVRDIPVGTYYMVMTTNDTGDRESGDSPEISKTVQ